ncbi:hypothetical protein [Kibdelosporangium aridum]|uniref:Uncharacterized protein n=1 Tax=Kibdelosporangium aridum TaxID=2030 RepID=A0A1W2G020_KIBAR|nr:hypothetical protein [Kibdelosporangium aridum]SMD27520.1 hypothetical protein SAMN05661093_11128 [Kibdelosporangium aridum]
MSVLPLVLVVLGCDAEPSPKPAGGDLVVSAAVAANEFGVGMVFPVSPPAGDAPAPGQDCRGAYEWARGRGALLEDTAHLRVTLRASRYAQVDGRAMVIRLVDRSAEFPGFAGRFSCPTGRYPDRGDPDVYEVQLPDDGSEVDVTSADFGGPLAAVGLDAGEERSFLVNVGVPKNGPTTRFEFVFRADVNGVERTYVLRDGDRPFMLMANHGGAGFSPDQYYWCPGSSKGLVHHSGDDDPLDAERPPAPPC